MLWCRRLIVAIVQCSAGKPNDKYNCKPVTCKIMGGPFKSWSLAEYSGHLIQNGLRSENVHTFSDSSLAVANLCFSFVPYVIYYASVIFVIEF